MRQWLKVGNSSNHFRTDPGTIYNSAGGSKIRDTVTKVLLGYIVAEAVDSFVDTLKFRHDVIEKYGTQASKPNKSELRSSWCF
jgi:hypothetical protein